jgi:hypothetical protein
MRFAAEARLRHGTRRQAEQLPVFGAIGKAAFRDHRGCGSRGPESNVAAQGPHATDIRRQPRERQIPKMLSAGDNDLFWTGKRRIAHEEPDNGRGGLGVCAGHKGERIGLLPSDRELLHSDGTRNAPAANIDCTTANETAPFAELPYLHALSRRIKTQNGKGCLLRRDFPNSGSARSDCRPHPLNPPPAPPVDQSTQKRCCRSQVDWTMCCFAGQNPRASIPRWSSPAPSIQFRPHGHSLPGAIPFPLLEAAGRSWWFIRYSHGD